MYDIIQFFTNIEWTVTVEHLGFIVPILFPAKRS